MHHGSIMSNTSEKSRMIIGMPVTLVWGYVAIALFMTGDGIEQAFLSKYIVGLGFTESRVSWIFTTYSFSVVIASWLSGMLAEMFGTKKVMVTGAILWVVLHTAFMKFSIIPHNYTMMLIFYGLRGLAYPLFFYAFFYWVIQQSPENQLASAIGWVWSMFTIGYGVIATFLPMYTVPRFGFEHTLWQSLVWSAAGGLITIFLLKSPPNEQKRIKQFSSFRSQISELSTGITLIFHSKDVALALITKAICNFSLFGVVVVVMPNFYTSPQGGQFSIQQWFIIMNSIFIIQPITNVLWGLIGDRIGWLKQIRWCGFIGCGTATILLYYIPIWFPGNLAAGIIGALFFALTVTAFVPMGALFPILLPNHKGAAVAIQSLSSGLSNLGGTGLISILFLLGMQYQSIFIIFGLLYYIAALLTCFIRLKQPKFSS